MQMPTVIRNTPSCLIPKELFREEKMEEYWQTLSSEFDYETIGKDDVNNFFLIYPKYSKENSIHEISLMYHDFIKKFPSSNNSICINVYDESFYILALNNQNIVFSGFFNSAETEDIIYHIANISKKIFEKESIINYYYQQLTSAVLNMLNTYFEMKPL